MIEEPVVVTTVAGRTKAEFVLSYLRAYGIHCEAFEESSGWLHGIEFGPVGSVDIMVAQEQADEARELLEGMEVDVDEDDEQEERFS